MTITSKRYTRRRPSRPLSSLCPSRRTRASHSGGEVVVAGRGLQNCPGARVGQSYGSSYESARGDELQVDVAVVRAGQGQYLEAAAYGEPQLDIVVIRGRQHHFLQATTASIVVEAGSP